MEALQDQLAEHDGGTTALLSRADSPLGGASNNGRPGDGGLNVIPRWQSVPMEALQDQFAEHHGGTTAVLTRAGSPVGGASNTGRSGEGLAAAIASALAAAASAPATLAAADYVEAAHFAGLVEELSRTVDYLQVLAAGAVDRTRTQAITAAATSRRTRAWITGWDTGTETLNETDATWPAETAADHHGHAAPASPADDGCKDTADFLRLRLRIGRTEARRRIHLSHSILPSTTLTGDIVPPIREHLAAALAPNAIDTAADTGPDTTAPQPPVVPEAAPPVSSRAGTIISVTLDRLRHHTTPENLDQIEHDLTRTAATADPDFLSRVAHRWAEALDADGSEPTEEALRHTQGAFIRKPRHGLHHLEIFATTDQYEHFATIMNAATNPRSRHASPSARAGTGTGTVEQVGRPNTGTGEDKDLWHDTDMNLDRRTRSQKHLDGIVGALKAALTTNQLPTAGGNRPQILATINYQDLLPHAAITEAPDTDAKNGMVTGGGTGAGIATCTEGVSTVAGRGSTGTGNYTFTGPIAAATLRKLACDADIIPALLGTAGEILDLGRKTRLFTPAQRLALTARDQGCAFPNCTIPAPWCEAHHITYWSQNGHTNTDNGALLCSHHHHLIHKEQWSIHIRKGVPWFTPPRHIDPTQKPQQNHYFKPPTPPQRK